MGFLGVRRCRKLQLLRRNLVSEFVFPPLLVSLRNRAHDRQTSREQSLIYGNVKTYGAPEMGWAVMYSFVGAALAEVLAVALSVQYAPARSALFRIGVDRLARCFDASA
jgi:hypothetical protein